MKLKILIVFIIIVTFPLIYNSKRELVKCNGIIENINMVDKTIKLKNVPEYVYYVPHIFTINNSTKMYIIDSSNKAIKADFNDLRLEQKITIIFDLDDISFTSNNAIANKIVIYNQPN